MGLFDDIKKVFQKKVEVNQYALKDQDKLNETLKKISNEFDKAQEDKFLNEMIGNLPDNLGMQKKEYQGKTDVEIEEEVGDKSKLDYMEGLKKVDDNILKEKDGLTEKKNIYEENKNRTLSELEENINIAKKNVENDAIKRGLARSSIVGERLGGLENKKISIAQSVSEKFNLEIAKIDSNVSGLEDKKRQALEELDIKNAIKITDEITKLKNERQARLNEVLEFNNKISEKEARFAKDKEETISKSKSDYQKLLASTAENESKNGYTGDKKANIEQRLETAFEFYKNYEPKLAKKMIEENVVLKNYLGDYYYPLLNMYSD